MVKQVAAVMLAISCAALFDLDVVPFGMRLFGKIRGNASLNGAPATCARVWIRSEANPLEVASAAVSADGSFLLEHVPLGQRYRLIGECSSGERGDLRAVEPDRPDPVELLLISAARPAV